MKLQFALMAVVSMGCGSSAKFLKLESRLVESNRGGEKEITSSPQYDSLYRGVTKVAVRAPDGCADQNASTTTGAARQDDVKSTLIKTSCGVEMAELERSLTKRGYQVVSWTMLASAVRADNHAYLDAARRLGAQVLFQVNSLERVNIFPGQDARLERRFYQSNRFGESLAPATLQDDSITRLRPLLLEQEQSLRKLGRLGVMLDANATVVESGQSVWFYRASKIEVVQRDNSASLLLTQKKREGWSPVSPVRQGEPGEQTRVARSAEMVAVSSGARSADEERAIYFALVRNAVDDFAQSFASGPVPLAPPPGMPPPPLSNIPPPPPMPPPAPKR